MKTAKDVAKELLESLYKINYYSDRKRKLVDALTTYAEERVKAAVFEAIDLTVCGMNEELANVRAEALEEAALAIGREAQRYTESTRGFPERTDQMQLIWEALQRAKRVIRALGGKA